MAVSRFDIDVLRWDQYTFIGRLKHFVNITDWRTALLPDSRLDESKALVESCRAASLHPGTTEEQLYDSAFHRDTGDRMNLIGRMSFHVPGGMAITGVIFPIIMQRLEDNKFMQRITFVSRPLQVMMVGAFLVFMVPAACSLFSQQCALERFQQT